MQIIQQNPKSDQIIFQMAKRIAEGLPPLISADESYTFMTILDYHGTAIAQVLICSCQGYELDTEDVWKKFKDFYYRADSFITTDTEHRDNCHLFMAQK